LVRSSWNQPHGGDHTAVSVRTAVAKRPTANATVAGAAGVCHDHVVDCVRHAVKVRHDAHGVSAGAATTAAAIAAISAFASVAGDTTDGAKVFDYCRRTSNPPRSACRCESAAAAVAAVAADAQLDFVCTDTWSRGSRVTDDQDAERAAASRAAAAALPPGRTTATATTRGADLL
jgi:hypothetical protein